MQELSIAVPSMCLESNNFNVEFVLFLKAGWVSRKSEGMCHLHRLRSDCHPKTSVVISTHAPEVATYFRWKSMYFGHVL